MTTKIIKFIIPPLAVLCLMFFLNYKNAVNKPTDAAGGDKVFFVAKGEGVERIGQNLFRAGLIRSEFYFKIYVLLGGRQSGFQAGNYKLSPAMSAKEIVDKLTRGEIANREKEIKIIEGWNVNDINDYLSENGAAPDGRFSDLANLKSEDFNKKFFAYGFLDGGQKINSLEGFLFPDTYKIFNDASAEDIIVKMLDNFNLKFSDEMRAEIKRQGKSLYDILITASIIEKEVAGDEDRAVAAGILYKRLDLGMRLQVDSTINYITGKNDPSSSYADLEIDSPYNTYKNDGLPPSPICNPGLSSITAAIYPEDSPYLFYLNRQDTGGTVFSKTYEEHLLNKAKYLK